MSELVEIAEGQVSPLKEPYRRMPYVGAENIESGTGRLLELKSCEDLGLFSGKYQFKSGAIIYSKIRPYLNKVALAKFDGLCSADAYPLYTTEVVQAEFLLHAMRSLDFVRLAVATSGRTGMPKVNRADLLSLPVLLPPLIEQRSISKALDSWDRTIEITEQMLAAKTTRLRTLRHQLLTGAKRFPRFKRKWVQVRMKEVLARVFRPVKWNPESLFRLISIRRRCGGLFERETLRGADYKTQDLHTLKADDFLVSKRQVSHGAWGLVSPHFAGAHVSKEYAILVNQAPARLHMPFFDWLMKQRHMWHLAYQASDGVHIEKLIFDPDDFLKNKILIPPTMEEQRKIATFLDACQREIDLLTRQLNAFKEQKRGLMQKLLTGEVRVH